MDSKQHHATRHETRHLIVNYAVESLIPYLESEYIL